MNALLKKEMKLSALLLTYLFIAFGAMTMIPGYPILCGTFFISLGLFQSFQSAREANDIVYSALLPVAKSDVVKGKYQFTAFIELCGFALMAVCTALRMTVFKDSIVYRHNALMNANLFYLAMALLIFALFNVILLGGYFKTGFNLGKPFVVYAIAAFIVIGIAEALHHFPGLEALIAFGTDHMVLQISLLGCGIVLYAVITYLSYKKACQNFEKVDL